MLVAESEPTPEVKVIGADTGAGCVETAVLIAVCDKCFRGLRLRLKRGGFRDVYPPAATLKSCWCEFHFVMYLSTVLGVMLYTAASRCMASFGPINWAKCSYSSATICFFIGLRRTRFAGLFLVRCSPHLVHKPECFTPTRSRKHHVPLAYVPHTGDEVFVDAGHHIHTGGILMKAWATKPTRPPRMPVAQANLVRFAATSCQ